MNITDHLIEKSEGMINEVGELSTFYPHLKPRGIALTYGLYQNLGLNNQHDK